MLTVKIMPEVLAKIRYLVDKAPGEISGLGKIQMIDGDMYVTSAVLCEQRNSGASTDLDGEDVAKVLYELRSEPGDVKFWWHSHANMQTFWSGTDRETIEELGNNGYLVATVFNKKNESRTAYYQGNVEGAPKIFLDDIKLQEVRLADKRLHKTWDEEYSAKVKSLVFTGGRGGTWRTSGDGTSTWIPDDKPAAGQQEFNYHRRYNNGYMDDDWGDWEANLPSVCKRGGTDIIHHAGQEGFRDKHQATEDDSDVTGIELPADSIGTTVIPLLIRRSWIKKFRRVYNRKEISFKEVESYYTACQKAASQEVQ